MISLKLYFHSAWTNNLCLNRYFQKYNGFPRVAKLVHAFYKKVLAEASLAPYFKEVPIEELVEHQINFYLRQWAVPINMRRETWPKLLSDLTFLKRIFQPLRAAGRDIRRSRCCR